jgi:hypothetical protein
VSCYKKKKKKETKRQKEKKASKSRDNTTQYFDKRIGLEDNGVPMSLTEPVYYGKHKIYVAVCMH